MSNPSKLDHKQLRELTAEAAGYAWRWHNPPGGGLVLQVCVDQELDAWLEWNPEYSDGDALRLAVKLDIQIEQNKPFKRACAMWYGNRVLSEEVFEPWGDEKLAATLPPVHRISTACEKLSVSKATIYRMAKAGKIELIKIGSRATRITDASLRQVLMSKSDLAVGGD